MIDPQQFRRYVIRPTLQHLKMWSPAAENLLLGTAAHESRLRYLVQDGGPALGFYQIEPSTHRDIWQNYLVYKAELASTVRSLAGQRFPDERHTELITNLAYATAIARLVYYRQPDPLPAPDDVPALARYWKKIYNTPKGKGHVIDFIRHYPG